MRRWHLSVNANSRTVVLRINHINSTFPIWKRIFFIISKSLKTKQEVLFYFYSQLQLCLLISSWYHFPPLLWYLLLSDYRNILQIFREKKKKDSWSVKWENNQSRMLVLGLRWLRTSDLAASKALLFNCQQCLNWSVEMHRNPNLNSLFYCEQRCKDNIVRK